MALLSFLFPPKPKTATAAKERLQIIIARERSGRGETALARASLARFLEVHPQEPVPADLRPLLP